MAAAEIHQAIETVFRIERARLIAGLARMVRDVGLAEELAQDACVIALSKWPRTGVPDNPGAWLMAAAKRRAIDAARRSRMLARKHEQIGRDQEDERDTGVEDIEAAMDDDVGDELLGLIFIACHPVLSTEARAALTLRLVGGLTTRLPLQRSHHRPAYRPRQAHARQCRPELRAAARQGAGAAPRLGAGGHLPHLQRGLRGHRR